MRVTVRVTVKRDLWVCQAGKVFCRNALRYLVTLRCVVVVLHLHRFATGRGVVLDRSKVEGRWQFRFRNPSFQSYVIMRGLSLGVITEGVVAKFRDNLPARNAFA